MKQHMTLCTLAVFIKIRKELYAGVHHLVFNFKQGITPCTFIREKNTRKNTFIPAKWVQCKHASIHICKKVWQLYYRKRAEPLLCSEFMVPAVCRPLPKAVQTCTPFASFQSGQISKDSGFFVPAGVCLNRGSVILPPYDNSYGQNTKMSARNLLLLKIQFIINILQDWTSGIF